MALVRRQIVLSSPGLGDALYVNSSGQIVNLAAGAYDRAPRAQGTGAAPIMGPVPLPSPSDVRFHWIQCSSGNLTGYESGISAATDVVTQGTPAGGDDTDGHWVSLTGAGSQGKNSQSGSLYFIEHNPRVEFVIKLPSNFASTDQLQVGFHKITGLQPPYLTLHCDGSAGPLKLHAFNPSLSPNDVYSSASFTRPAANSINRLMVRWDNTLRTLYGSLNGSAEISLDLSAWGGVTASGYGWVCQVLSTGAKTTKFGTFVGRWRAFPGGPT